MPISRRALGAAGAVLLAAPNLARAQSWSPTRPVRLVVGFPPGGSGDFIARTLSEPLREALGQAVVVDNRPGAGSNIASEAVARAEPDGHTLLLGGNFSHAVNPALYARIPFHPVRDFTAITRLTDLPTILAVRPQLGITTLAQLIERVRAEPGRWNYATPGNGTPSHLAGVMLARTAGIELTHVPFRGGAPSLQAVLSGDVELLIGTPPVALPPVRGGQLRALSLTTREASPVIEGIPGTGTAGLPGLNIGGWWGLWAPAGLPEPIRQRVFEAARRITADPGVRERLAREGLQGLPSESPAAFDAFIAEEIPFWADVVRAAGARVD
ncbi:Bug family tripartite tricarboxylate transporter substrate binding protein [Roseococcus thiosulfatophilus]|uniref:Bug family tripartite tricarboxylate transporter substrate binding protein n=1 Tax=Roseococcus thiosulfatophilus TaxID=35813 RepID=UPI001A8E32E9|nr:tripartite tricarboxylate transporter substrate binding protein [Roseococcus thiosulfatophilus]